MCRAEAPIVAATSSVSTSSSIAISSAVGVNKKIVDHNINGFLCSSETEWYAAIEKLILDPELRKRMGTDGRKKITREYSLLSNEENFLALFT